MTGQMVLILVCMVGGIIAFGVLTQLLEGAGRQWKELAAHYPAQGAAPDATRGEAKIYVGADLDRLTKQMGFRRGCLTVFFMPWKWMQDAHQVRYAADDEYLHLETEGGRLAPRSAMSIPWGAIDTGERFQSEMGEHVVLGIGDVMALVPATAIARELELRAAAESGPDAEPDQRDVDWSEQV